MNLITSDDILGKEAIDPEGEVLGVVTKLHIDKKEKKMLGITIDQGFMKPEMYIGIKNIKNFGIDTIFLNKIPYEKIEGKKIITAKGKILGRVKEVIKKRNKIQIIRYSKKMKKYQVNAKEIEEIGENIILKKEAKPKEI